MFISREKLELHQIWLYILAIVSGAGFGIVWPQLGSNLDPIISSVLAILLYGMFTQIPFLQLRKALENKRFIVALLSVNFVAVPVLVWLLTHFLPNNPAILLGVCLVLLAPCIDYVIIFTQLGKGNEKLMLASTPLLFLAQLLLLPVYLWLFIGKEAAEIVEVRPFLESFLVLIVVPLGLAVLNQLWAKHQDLGKKVLRASTWIPVLFMALALFVIIASQIDKVIVQFASIAPVIPVYIAFMAITPIIALLASRLLRLDTGASRALAFSAGTRNSLVVLPLALALPEALATLVAAVIVTQTIVELAGELVYIRLLPWVIQSRN